MPSAPRIAAAILAAGTGEPHRLRDLATRVCSVPIERTAVVLGNSAGALAPVLHGLPLHQITNVLHPEGRASGIRAAVGWALRSGCDSLLLLACDHHQVTAHHLEQLLASYRGHRDIVATRCAHGLCLPAVFHAIHFARLAGLTGERCAETVLATTPGLVTVVWPDGDRELAA
jgi:CTP:molybdopterin cytidylyltransferase MocA